MTLTKLFSVKTPLIALFLSINFACWSTTDFVDNDPNELQAAITSGTADTIRFNFSGTMDFAALGVLQIERAVVLYSSAPGNVIFDGSLVNGLLVSAPPGAQVELHGITFINFAASAIALLQGDLVVNNCVFEDNSGTNGGAILSDQTENALTVTRCAFFTNNASVNGGAIYAVDEFKLVNCTFYQNVSGVIGGAVYYEEIIGYDGEVAFNTFYSNAASAGDGGGLYANTTGLLLLFNNLFVSNSGGGNPDCYSSDPSISQGYNYFAPGGTNVSMAGGDVSCCAGSVPASMRTTAITDGYGQKYFTNDHSTIRDVGTNYYGLSSDAVDQRGGFRKMDESGAGPLADIGAIEHTHFTVTNNDGGNAVAGSIGRLVDDLNSGVRQSPYYFAFDITGSTTIEPMNGYQVDGLKVVVDGFTQPGSKVPGYKDMVGGNYITPGIMGAEISGVTGASDGLFIMGSGADSSEIRGLSFINFTNSGIYLQDVSNVKVDGNHLGITADGMNSGPNQFGLYMDSSYSAKIGGSDVTERNVISGNVTGQGHGIDIRGCGDVHILNNLIGTDAYGTTGVGNYAGIVFGSRFATASSDNLIGTSIANRTSFGNSPYHIASNIISGNSGGGFQSGIVFVENSSSNSVSGNFIGLDVIGSTLASSNYIGILLDDGSGDNSIGVVTNSLTRNVISGNTKGIQFSTSSLENSINNNWIGTIGEGTGVAPNTYGIYIDQKVGGYNMIVGGSGALDGNVISGNTTAGVLLDGADGVAATNRLSFEGNKIGLAPDGITPLANGKGIHSINGSEFIEIGSANCSGCGNVISGNGNYGVHLDGVNDVVIYNNTIGLDIIGNSAPNTDGIHVDNSNFVTIGGMSANQPNDIGNNSVNGVTIVGSVTTGVDLSANSIHENGGIGVDINLDGATANDPGDTDSGPNGVQNYPELVQAFYCGDSAKTMIEYDVSFESGFNYAVQFFIADADDEEGKNFLGEHLISVTTTPQRFVYPHPSSIAGGTVIVANASKINGTLYSTSEFSSPIAVETPVLAITSTNPSICGTADGSIAIESTPALTSSWDYDLYYDDDGTSVGPSTITTDASGILTLTALDSGTYNNIKMDIAGCMIGSGSTINLSFPAVPNPSMTGPVSVCEGATETYSATGNGGAFSWTISGGTLAPATGTPVVASWPSVSAANITVTEQIGSCTASESNTVTIHSLPTVTASGNPINCFGGNDGTLNAVGSGGSGSYTYAWNIMGAGASHSPVGPGIHIVIATDGNACEATDTVVLTEPTAVVATASATDETCDGDNDGTLSSSGSGGTGSYFFSWDGGPSPFASNQTGVSLGTYVVTVTDGNGCSDTQSATVAAGTLLTSVIDPIGNQCLSGNSFSFNGGNSTISSGTITSYGWLFGDGGTASVAAPAYTYGAPGTYTVTLTIGDGTCTAVETLDIIVYPDPTVSITSLDPSCNGSADGQATATGSGGTGTLDYSWSPTGGSASTATGLSGGITYTVTVTDDNGCTATDNTTLTEPTAVVAAATSTNETCSGDCDGTLSASGSGGSGSYGYDWFSPGPGSGQTHTAQCSGTYSVAVFDDSGCADTATTTIASGTLLTSVIDPIGNQCLSGNSFSFNGGNSTISSGTITSYGWLFGDGGTASVAAPAYTYGAPGTYTVTLTIGDGTCTAVETLNISVYEDPTVSITSSSDPNCTGSSDGTATASGSGGTGTLDYSWSPSGGSASIATGLSGGITYTVTVTDDNGCTATDDTTLTEPSVVVAGASATDQNCNGICDGTLTSTGSGGTGSITYNWDGGPSPGSQNQTGVCPGTYTVTVTDGNGCSDTQPATVAAGTLLTAVIDPIGNQCLSGNSFSFNGGNSAISAGSITSYIWDFGDGNSATGSTASNTYSSAGVYTVTLIVGDGTCTATETLDIIIYPDPTVSITSSSDPNCTGSADGTATASGSGGTGTLDYSWSPSGGSFSIGTGLSGGITYTVTVTDDNGCTATNSAALTDPTLLTVSITSNDPTCAGVSDGNATALGVGGTAPLSYSWSPTGGSGTTAIGLTAGIEYVVTVTDSNSCTAIDSVTLSDPPVISFTTTAVDAMCSGVCDGEVSWTASGGTGIITSELFLIGTPDISHGSTNPTTGLCTGDYFVIHTDGNLCVQNSDTVTINEPTLLTVSITSNVPSCTGLSDGDATALGAGGTGTLNYTWIPPGSAGPAVSGLTAGIEYVVTVTDGNSCTASDSVTLTDPPPVNLVITDPAAVCAPFTVDLTAAAVTTGSDPGTLTYWTDLGATTPLGSPTSVATSGTYFIQLDDGSCTAVDSVHVVVNAQPTVEAGPDQMVCDGDLITVTGSGALSFVWDNSAVDGVPFGQAVGTVMYTVTGTDASGCEGNDSLFVTVTTLPFVEGDVTDATCGLSNGSVEAINASGGTLPYTYSFAGGPFSTTTLFTGLGAGSYSLAIEDSLGCPYSTNVVVNSTGSLPLTPVLNGPFDFCEGDPLGPIDATGTVEAGTFNWYLNDTTAPPIATTASSAVTLSSLPTGSNVLYVIHSITASGCVSASGSAIVNYYNKDYTISPSFTYCPGGTVQFDGVLGSGSIVWSDPAGELSNGLVSDPTASPTNDSTTYTFVYQNGACSFSDSVAVYLDTAGCGTFVDITNAFSPDGDGVNDGWEIDGIDLHPNNQVFIFNRWGDLINEFTGYNNSDVVWNGNGSSNEMMPSGTYFYVLELLDSGTSQSGWVQLTR